MAVNKRKILESARKLVQKGAKDKALAEYQKLLRLDPKDAKLRLEIGDAHRRWGQVDEAIETYTRVAEQYTREGFDARAVAVYKQILNLDPDRYASYEPLAELYERMGLVAEAINALQTAADGFHRQGKKREALELLRRMATIDPANTTSRLKVADLLRQEGLQEEAVSEYVEVAEELERQGDLESLCNAYRRILELDPSRPDVMANLARSLVAQGDAAGAESYAVQAVEASPQEPSLFELLADVYRSLGREDALPDVYRRLADVHRQRGDEEQARDILQRFVPPDAMSISVDDEPVAPSGDDGGEEVLADDALAGVGAAFDEEFLAADSPVKADDSPFASSGLSADALQDEPIELEEPTREVGLEMDPDLQIELEPPPDDGSGAAVVEPEAVPASPPRIEDPEQLLAEASVYLRYGKRDQAISHLETLIAGDPDNRMALDKLGEAYAEGGEEEQAVQCWTRAVKQARLEGDEDAARVLRGRIASLDESAAAALEPLPAEPPPEADPLEADAGSARSDEETFEAEIDLADIDIELEGDDLGAGELEEGDLDGGLLEENELDASGLSDEEFGEPDLETGAPPASAAGSHAPLPESVGTPVPAADETPSSGDSTLDSPSLSGSSLSSTTSQQLLEDLEEADFYVQQNLLDEAEEIYKRVLSIAPNHPRALVRLGEVAAARGGDPGTTGPSFADLPTPPPARSDAVAEEQQPGDELAELDDELLTDVSEDESPETVSTRDEAPEPASTEDAPEPDEDRRIAAESEAPDEAAEPGFDLAAELSDAFDEDPAGTTGTQPGDSDDGFASVFDAFKRGVSETLSDGDHDAHYDLGIAYKEMGLLDDAVAEFRAAMASPQRRIECLHLIGLCALDGGQPDVAIEHLDHLLASPGISDEQKLAGRFDLGRAYALAGDVERARTAFESVASVSPGFQDVRERLDALDGAAKPEEPVEVDDDAGYESFEDLIGEDEAGSGADPVLGDGDSQPVASAEETIADARFDAAANPAGGLFEGGGAPDGGGDTSSGDLAPEDASFDTGSDSASDLADDTGSDTGSDTAPGETSSRGRRSTRRKKKISFV